MPQLGRFQQWNKRRVLSDRQWNSFARKRKFFERGIPRINRNADLNVQNLNVQIQERTSKISQLNETIADRQRRHDELVSEIETRTRELNQFEQRIKHKTEIERQKNQTQTR